MDTETLVTSQEEDLWNRMDSRIKKLEDENRRLRECAIKYLKWHDVENAEEGLEKDLKNPEMCKQ